jgi:DNA processing protein
MDDVFALDDEELVAGLVPEAAARERLLRYRDSDAERARAGRAEREAATAARLDAICRHAAEYPGALRDLAGPPAVVFTTRLARLRDLTAEPAVAIVGARRASAYGLEVARALGRGLSAAGVTVVSGMAMGVDSAAHEGALEAGARTTAVLGGGVDVPYPATKRALHARLRDEAVLVSEFPPGFRPRRWTFPARNRIIAGLAALTVVVEAGPRSGALITTRIARELGREVGAVPGRVTSPLAGGPNDLLRDGAHLVDGPQAALDLLYGAGGRSVPAAEVAPLEPFEDTILSAVREGRDVASAGPPAEVLATLGELELRGLVRRAPGGAWVAVAS